ncbi:MAG: hypothetical protein ABSF22_23785 [Bryobacteraceae bacterium]
MPDPELPSVDSLQFRRAQPIHTEAPGATQSCAACKQPISGQYYQVRNQVICPSCAAKIEAGRQSPKPLPIFRAVIYGAAAALAGCLLYAAVLAMGVQIGIVAIAVGWMVGKAIRHASYGLGGRPQQILAVALTYFAISTSVLPAGIFLAVKHANTHSTTHSTPAVQNVKQILPGILLLAAASPFLELGSSPASGILSIIILFVGLRYAWALTARHEILVAGPYS